MSPNKEPQITSLTTHHYVTDHLETGVPVFLDDQNTSDSLSRWIHGVAVPSDIVERYATYQQIGATVHLPDEDNYVTLLSERRNVSGYTYINGVLCNPETRSVTEGLRKIHRKLGSAVLISRGSVEEQLAQLDTTDTGQVIIGRFGHVIAAFRKQDSIVRAFGSRR